MRTSIPVAAMLLLGAATAPAQQETAANPLRLAFVGDVGTPRTEQFVAFLRERFAAVDVHARAADRDQALQQADVVLLDWPQSDAARAERAAGWSPLGERDAWHTPTVLLSSAGLNLAGSWQIRGGFG